MQEILVKTLKIYQHVFLFALLVFNNLSGASTVHQDHLEPITASMSKLKFYSTNSDSLSFFLQEISSLSKIKNIRCKRPLVAKIVMTQIFLLLYIDLQISYCPQKPFHAHGLYLSHDLWSPQPRKALYFCLNRMVFFLRKGSILKPSDGELLCIASAMLVILDQFSDILPVHPLGITELPPSIVLKNIDPEALKNTTRMSDGERVAWHLTGQIHDTPSIDLPRFLPLFMEHFSRLTLEHSVILEHILILIYKHLAVHIKILANNSRNVLRDWYKPSYYQVIKQNYLLFYTLIQRYLHSLVDVTPIHGFSNDADEFRAFVLATARFLEHNFQVPKVVQF